MATTTATKSSTPAPAKSNPFAGASEASIASAARAAAAANPSGLASALSGLSSSDRAAFSRGSGVNYSSGPDGATVSLDPNISVGVADKPKQTDITPFNQGAGIDYSNIVSGLNQLGAQASSDQYLKNLQDTTSQKQNDLFTQATKLIGEPESVSDIYARARQETGLTEKQQRVADLTGQLNQITSQAEANKLAIVGQGRGIPDVIIGGQQAEIGREAAIQALPVSASLNAAQGNLEMAQNNLNTLFQIRSQEATNKYNYKKDLVGKIFDMASKQEQNKLEVAMKMEDRKYVEQQKNIDISRSVAMTAAKNGAPASVIGDISKATSPEQAIIAGANYMGDPLERRIKIAELARQQQQTITDTKINKLDPNSPTYTKDMLVASAGGNKMTDADLAPIKKGMQVVNQIGELQESMRGANTGPLISVLRSNNPYDVKAQMIKAQLQGLVPNLARSAYGEVGVLTNEDINNYIKTLPNLSSPEQLNKMLLSMTLKTVKSGIDSNLQVSVGLGKRDGSGFADVYSKLDDKISSLDKEIGAAPANAALGSYLDSALPKTSSNPTLDWLQKFSAGPFAR